MSMIKKASLSLIVGVFVSACAVDTSIQRGSVQVEEIGQQTDNTPEALNNSLDDRYVAMLNRNETYIEANSAISDLLARAEQQQSRGQLQAAANTLERALRISPRNPLLWHQLAALRYQQGNLQQALQMAAKSNSFAGKDKHIQVKNWQVISHIKRQQGDQEGASAAQATLSKLLK